MGCGLQALLFLLTRRRSAGRMLLSSIRFLDCFGLQRIPNGHVEVMLPIYIPIIPLLQHWHLGIRIISYLARPLSFSPHIISLCIPARHQSCTPHSQISFPRDPTHEHTFNLSALGPTRCLQPRDGDCRDAQPVLRVCRDEGSTPR